MSVEYTYSAWSTADEFKPVSTTSYHSDDGPFTYSSEVTDCNTSDSSVPAWESEPVSWDFESAKKLAEKLLCLDVNTDQEISSDLNDANSNDGPNPRFKTEFCRNFREKGTCVYGDHCQFAHGKVELRPDIVRHSKYKTKLCQKYWIAGYCAYGPRCNFIHQECEVPDPKPSVGGFKPFHSFRKQSESSVDSGFDSGFSVPPPKQPTKDSKMIFPPLKLNYKLERSTYTEVVKSSPQPRYPNLLTDMNSNLPSSCFNAKGMDSVPHPEHNPIPAGVSFNDMDVFERFDAGIWSNMF